MPEVAPPELEVSVVLLEEADEGGAYAEATVSMPSITADVLDALDREDTERSFSALPPVTGERPQGVDTLLVGVEELLALGDPASALELLHKAERHSPDDARLVEARVRCQYAHVPWLEARLGPVGQVPRLKLRMVELMKLSLDARMGFLLSRIDGHSSYEALFSVSGMSRLETLRALVQLLEQDIITLAPR